MVKIGGPVNTDSHNDNDRSARKYLPSKRGCFKFGCLMPLGLFLIMAVIGALFGDPEEGSDDDTEQATQTEELRYEDIDTSIEAREYSVGKADKHISELGDLDPQPVDNDQTGNWRVVEHDKGVDFTPYVLSYAEEHMNDGEIHWIVDRTNNTLTWIMDARTYLMVTIYEHNEDDGIDAGSLGGGFELGDYWVYKDNGDIEDVDAIIRDEEGDTTDDNVDYTAWSNPERFNMTNEDDDYFLRSIKIEGLVAQILVENDIYFLSVAMDGYDERPVLVSYDSNITTPSFEIGDNLVIEGVSIELFDAGDGTYYPAMMAFSYNVK